MITKTIQSKSGLTDALAKAIDESLQRALESLDVDAILQEECESAVANAGVDVSEEIQDAVESAVDAEMSADQIRDEILNYIEERVDQNIEQACHTEVESHLEAVDCQELVEEEIGRWVQKHCSAFALAEHMEAVKRESGDIAREAVLQYGESLRESIRLALPWFVRWMVR